MGFDKLRLKRLQFDKFNKLSSKSHTIIIILYGIVLTAALLGFGNIYGHKTDWLSQHTVFPEIFRQNFYENKTLVPNFLFDIGSGQNIFNFTYYGFLSPGILLSYLFPFVDMMIYIIVFSLVSYLATGVLVYNFLRRHFDSNKAFICAILALTLPPFTNHFHHHIMFVWYIPFFVLSLIGLDKFFENGKFLLFIVSTFLMIMTNYYFSVSGLVFLFAYAVYWLLKKNDKICKEFFKNAANVVFLFATPILLSAFLLLPTAYQIMGNSRIYSSSVSVKDLVIPYYGEYFYLYSGIGISGIILLAAIGNLCRKNKSKAEIFLNGFAIFVVTCPLLIYALNGMLYVRGKVAAGFAIIFLYCFCSFMQNLAKKEINLKLAVIVYVCYLSFSVFFGKPNLMIGVALAVELLIFLLIRKKSACVYIFIVLVFLTSTISANPHGRFLSIDYYNEMHYDETENLADKIPDGLHRTSVLYNTYDNSNKVYGDNFHTTSVYSSTSNRAYQNFYLENIGNNQNSRNCFVVSGAENELFYTFTGTRYLISDCDPGFYYDEVSKGENLNLYENKYAYPLAYKSQKIISRAQFEKLEFPYSAECLMHYTVVEDAPETEFVSELQQCKVNDSYQFVVDEEEKEYTITLDEKYRNQILYLSFDVFNEGEYFYDGDLSIGINGISNKLTTPGWLYYNGNTNFQYIIPLENTTELNIMLTEGKYDIRNVKMFTSGMIYNDEYVSPENFVIDEKTEKISGKVVANEGDYFVTSIPYDKGFEAYINGEKADTVVVNEAFLGVRLGDGENNVVIKYRSPLFIEGVIISLFGLLLLIAAFFKNIIFGLMKKYREIIMYIIFGVATTIVSLVTYFLCSKFIFDTTNMLQLQAANVISWVISVAFAYVTNKKFVFQSHAEPLRELVKFYLSRVSTLVVEMILMYLLVTVFSVNDMFSKIVVQFIVIVLNYILGKILVFREAKKC